MSSHKFSRRSPKDSGRSPKPELPSDQALIGEISEELKGEGVFESFSHLKTYNFIRELGVLLSTISACVIGGPTGSGKTIGSIAYLAMMFAIYDISHISTVYISIPLRKGVSGAYKYCTESILNRSQARNVGWAAGGEVAYRREQIRICTTGHVFNRLAKILVNPNDRHLLNTMLVIIDEAHTPTSENYLLIALCLYIQEIGFNLRMVIMSATLDSAPLLEEFEDAPKIELEGHLYDLTTVFHQTTPSEKDVNKAAVDVILKYTSEGHNILCFVAGESDIQEIMKALNGKPGLYVCGLISNMPQDEMDLAFQEPPIGSRKVIISTNIAESSVTIPGIDVVVDTGYEIRAEKPATGRGMVYVKDMISQASASQRAGRVGRVSPGINHRMWTESHQRYSMQKHTKSNFYSCDPEIQVLRLVALGLDSQRITRLDSRRHAQVIQRLTNLQLVEKIDPVAAGAAGAAGTSSASGASGLAIPEFVVDYQITNLGRCVLKYQTTLDTSVALAHLEKCDDYTAKVVGTLIVSLIEGCNGYLPFWVARDRRDDVAKNGFDDADFGGFKGHDDIETFFLMFFGEDGLFQYSVRQRDRDLSFETARNYGDVSKIRREWTKERSLNLKNIKGAMRIFQQSIGTMLGRNFNVPEIHAVGRIDSRIFSPMEYDYIDEVLNIVRTQLAKTFVGERYKAAMVRVKMGSEPGYVGSDYRSYRFDKRRSYCRLMQSLSTSGMPNVLPFNIAITRAGTRFISAIMIDPRIDVSVLEGEMTLNELESIKARLLNVAKTDEERALVAADLLKREIRAEERGRLEERGRPSSRYGSPSRSSHGSPSYGSGYGGYGGYGAGRSSRSPSRSPKKKATKFVAQPQTQEGELKRRHFKLDVTQFTYIGGW